MFCTSTTSSNGFTCVLKGQLRTVTNWEKGSVLTTITEARGSGGHLKCGRKGVQDNWPSGLNGTEQLI